MRSTLSWAQDSESPQVDGSNGQDGDGGTVDPAGDGGTDGPAGDGGTNPGGPGAGLDDIFKLPSGEVERKVEYSVGGPGSPGESVVSSGDGGGSSGDGGGSSGDGGGSYAPSSPPPAPPPPEARQPSVSTAPNPMPAGAAAPSVAPVEREPAAGDGAPIDVGGDPPAAPEISEGPPPLLNPALFDLLFGEDQDALAPPVPDAGPVDDGATLGGLASRAQWGVLNEPSSGVRGELSLAFWLAQGLLICVIGKRLVARWDRPHLGLRQLAGGRLAELRRRRQL
ncbi:MAG: hypothetical protein ACRDZO_09525 [Egibacteraceae bacterium]